MKGWWWNYEPMKIIYVNCWVKNYFYCVIIVIVFFSNVKMLLHESSPGVWLFFNRDAIIYGASCFTSGLPMVMEVLSEGVLQPKLMDEEVEKATNKNNIIYSKNILCWLLYSGSLSQGSTVLGSLCINQFQVTHAPFRVISIFFFALELPNALQQGRKKRANAPSSINTAALFIDCTVEYCILMCDFLFWLT